MVGLMQTVRAVLRRVPLLASKAQPDLIELLYVAFLFPPLAGKDEEGSKEMVKHKADHSDASIGLAGRPVFEPTNSTIIYASNQVCMYITSQSIRHDQTPTQSISTQHQVT